MLLARSGETGPTRLRVGVRASSVSQKRWSIPPAQPRRSKVRFATTSFLPTAQKAAGCVAPLLLLPAKSHAAPPLFACKRAHNALACYQLFAEKGKGTAFSLPSGPRFCPSVIPAQPKIGRRCKVSADFYFFTIHDSLFTAWQGRFLEGNSEERRVKSCGGGALRRNKKRGKDAGPPQEKPPDVPTGSCPACYQLFAEKGKGAAFFSGLHSLYKIPAGEAQRDFPVLSGHRPRRAKPRGIFLSCLVTDPGGRSPEGFSCPYELPSLPLG